MKHDHEKEGQIEWLEGKCISWTATHRVRRDQIGPRPPYHSIHTNNQRRHSQMQTITVVYIVISANSSLLQMHQLQIREEDTQLDYSERICTPSTLRATT